ncbi:MAG: Hpt domain-containing protein, partial [Thermodesulfobacteriota bacterium]
MNESPYKALYLQEMSERLSGIEKGLLSLETSNKDKTVVDALFRHYHSIKGMSASMGFEPIKVLAHLQEDALEGFRSAGSFPGKATISILFECLDALRQFLLMVENSEALKLDIAPLMKRLKESATADNESPPRPNAEPAKEIPAGIIPSMQISRTMKVDAGVFDSLLKTTGNLLTALSGLKSYSSAVRSIKLKDLAHELEKSIEELNSDILSARMLPFGDLTQNLPRIVRDISARYGKEVDLVVEGADITLDRAILEGMGDPLVHIMKNALDHGIEPVAERKKAGKPERGTITVKASQKKDM